MSRRRSLAYVEVVYAAVGLAVAVALIFTLGPADNVVNGTSVRILGAAVLSLGVGALAVAHDPVGNRVMLRVQIIFTTLSAFALAWKLAVEHSATALWLLLPLVVFIVLLLVLSPAARPAKRHEVPMSPPRQE